MLAMQPDPLVLQQLIDTIVREVHPLRIILFGSAANGTMREDSDLDVMVVVPEPVNPYETSHRVMMAMPKTVRRVPIDIFFASEEAYTLHRNTIGLLYKEVEDTGVELYKAS